jgi:hypothetical protein
MLELSGLRADAVSMRELCPHLRKAIALTCWLVFSGCASVPTAAPPDKLTHLVVANQTDAEWRLAIAPRDAASAARVIQVAAREVRRLELPAGDYVIEQTLLTSSPNLGASRQITIGLAPGRTYRWRLTTLLSVPPGGPHP